MRTQRGLVDHSLQRRALLRQVKLGRIGVNEVCDASPYLVRAAYFHGARTDNRCPVCAATDVWLVNYTFGDALGTASGQARRTAELAVMEMSYTAFDVYVVEVCRSCHFNHLWQRFTLGRDGYDGHDDPPPPRRIVGRSRLPG